MVSVPINRKRYYSDPLVNEFPNVHTAVLPVGFWRKLVCAADNRCQKGGEWTVSEGNLLPRKVDIKGWDGERTDVLD